MRRVVAPQHIAGMTIAVHAPPHHALTLGEALAATGDTEEAETALTQAAALSPKAAEPHLALAQLNRGTEEAEKELTEAARVSPSGMTFYLVGKTYREEAAAETDPSKKASLVRSAIDAYEKSRLYDPHNLQALANAAPSDIKHDVKTLASAVSRYLQVAAGYNTRPLPPGSMLVAAAQSLDAPKIKAAERHLDAWRERNCN